jgi:uroporphyrinogen decarboxylase
VAAGAHGIIIADDIAYHRSTYISPEFVEHYLLPIWKTQVKAAWNLGVPIFFHSDGNLNAVLPLVVEAGFDGLQCIEPAAGMDINDIKQRYGRNLCLMGNMDPSLLTEKGNQIDTETSYDHLRQSVFELMKIADEDGGFIFGTCSGLFTGMSPEIVQTMYRLANEFDSVMKVKSNI